jgi:ATP/maltotriose-dependent transcriptional regulator MalT
MERLIWRAQHSAARAPSAWKSVRARLPGLLELRRRRQELAPRAIQVRITTLPAPLLWTRDDYHQLIDTGPLAGRRVQLLEGQLIELPPMNSPHIGAMKYLYRVLVLELGDRVSSQTPIIIPAHDGRPASEPEPDVFVSERLRVPGGDTGFSAAGRHWPLSPRQREVAALIAGGSSNRQIGGHGRRR